MVDRKFPISFTPKNKQELRVWHCALLVTPVILFIPY